MSVYIVTVGAAIGLVYTLSPLLVLSLFAVAVMFRAIASTGDPVERRWLLAMAAAAVSLRFVAIAALFLSTDHDVTPFGTFFGDEDYFIKRSIWLRNTAVGIPISPADMRYAFDPLIDTSYVWILAALQILVGPSPYGVHLVGSVVYVGAAVLLYRAIRSVFGVPAALIGLGLLLFLPSLFIWSLSALKDPLFLALVAVVLALAIVVLRASGLRRRIAAGQRSIPCRPIPADVAQFQISRGFSAGFCGPEAAIRTPQRDALMRTTSAGDTRVVKSAAIRHIFRQ